MIISEDISQLFADTYSTALTHRYEYMTPELLLYTMCQREEFIEVFTSCGGDVAKLMAELKGYCDENLKVEAVDRPETSDGLNRMLMYADFSAQSSGREEIGLSHLVHGMYQLEECYATYFMALQGVDEVSLLQSFAEIQDEYDDEMYENYEEEEDEHVDGIEAYAPCLNDSLDGVNPLIGRENELERTIQILCRKPTNKKSRIN